MAGVARVLADFDLLHLLTQAGTITGTILSNNSNLLGSLALRVKGMRKMPWTEDKAEQNILCQASTTAFLPLFMPKVKEEKGKRNW